MTKVYEYSCYRKFIKEAVDDKRKMVPSFTFARLAESVGIQKSYLSQVINGRGTLNSDQIYLIGKKLGINQEEQYYLNLLLELDRCQIPERKKTLEKELSKLRSQHYGTSEYIDYDIIEAVENEFFAHYYSDPYCSLVHIFLSIEKYQRSPLRIAQRLEISTEKLSEVLDILEKCGITSTKSGAVELIKKSIHLDGKSFLSRTNASMFRLKAIEQQQKSKNEDDYFFTASFSTNEEVRQKIKKRYLEFLKEVTLLVKKEEAKEVFHINFDLFRV